MMCNQALIMTNYDNTNQNMATLKHFKEAAENCGFRVSVPMTQGNETTIELYQQLPSGKDWWETLQFAVVFQPVCPKSVDFRDAVQS